MADEAGKGGGFIAKVVATVFGAVIAPVLVALGVKYMAPKDDPKPEPPPVVQAKADKDKTDGAEKPDKEKGKPTVLDPVHHMADSDLARWWYVYERIPEKDKTGKETGTTHFQLAKAKEAGALFGFDIHEEAIHAPGGNKIGALVSKELAYENYHLTVEYKWGPVPPPSKPRRSGVILHGQDSTEQRPFMPGIVCVIVPGDAGALHLRGSDVRVKAAVAEKVEIVKEKVETAKPPVKEKTDTFKLTKDKAEPFKLPKDKVDPLKTPKDKVDPLKTPKDKVDPLKTPKDKVETAKKGHREVLRRDYKPGAAAKLLTIDAKWPGLIHRLGNDPTLGEDDDPIVGKDDLEKSDWNKLECVCEGDTISVRLNGKEVNACTGASPHKGRIVVLAEGSNLFFRRIDLLPLKK